MGKLAVKKLTKYIEDHIHLDSSCTDTGFYNNFHYMQTAEEICSQMERGSIGNDATLKFLEIVASITTNKNDLVDTINEYGNLKNSGGSTRRVAESKLNFRLAEFYEEIGKTFDETKMIDSLVKRNNKFFRENDLDFMSTNRETALREFSRTDSSITVMFSKITFWINKLTKYVSYAEYYNNYKEDTINSKERNEQRIQYISKLKTDFVQEVFNLTKEQSSGSTYKEILDELSEKYQETYQKLFGSSFKNLDLSTDFDNIMLSNILRDKLYSLKTLMSTYCIASLLSDYQKGSMPKSISNWGFSKDANGKYVLNINIANYPLPLSMHITKEQLSIILTELQGLTPSFLTSTVKFPEYKSIRTSSGSVVSTNILYVPSAQQRDRIKEKAKEHPKNRLIQALYNQTSKKMVDIKNQDIIQISKKELSAEL